MVGRSEDTIIRTCLARRILVQSASCLSRRDANQRAEEKEKKEGGFDATSDWHTQADRQGFQLSGSF